MRLPLAPSADPPTDKASASSVFNVVNMLRPPHSPVFQRVSSEVATERKWDDNSLLVENMVGGFAQRCDNLMEDFQYGMQAPGLFGPAWMISTYSAGTRNENWLLWWSHMRARKS